ncbi:RHS repeat domain-containing protein [Pseudomonas sp. DSP3-2-2]|uniref:RHS repeat domain-containing protein n=1 Tax=unclassified Pseudomonas TaxID=196821 RepID=UPI003CE7911C
MLAGWDGRGTERWLEYDVLLRPTAISENDQCLERLQYGDADAAAQNQCGQLVRHDDPAGTRRNIAFGLTGAVLEQTQYFLADLDDPDWPALESERDALLEPGAGASTHWAYTPLGEVIRQTDVLGNVQAFAYTVAGQLKAVSAQLKDQPEQVLVSAIRYDAQGRVESDTAGNGVITRARYRDEDGRLIELNATRNNGEHLQDSLYDYDPVGNVIRIEDRAQPTRFFANQRIEPVSNYQYDTLYQLIEATGREAATVNHGPVFPEFQSPADPTQLANYAQTYRYDAGGNLQQLTHVGAQAHSRTLVTARCSNRSLPVVNDQPPDEETIAAAFDANGNLLQLQAGQTLNWDWRNQLQQVRPVVRETADDDSEHYVYDASGQRQRKVRISQAKNVSHQDEVRYLPGLEIRTNSATGETLQVICAQAGRNGVRVLHWQAGKPDDLTNDQYRYTLNDHLGSGTLELDNDAQIISQESYYPFGGTSWWAGRNTIEASYKTVRYSGKERDATGLYYYGLRYYAPWLQRWINPDPFAASGLSKYAFVDNRPVCLLDCLGLAPVGYDFLARGLSTFPPDLQRKTREAIELTKEMLQFTLEHMASNDEVQPIERVLTESFGAERAPDFHGKLTERMGDIQQLINGLESAQSSRLGLAKLPKGIRGEATKAAQTGERVIVLSEGFIKKAWTLDIAKTLIHEASHAVQHTHDFAYIGLNKTLRKGTGQAIDKYVQFLRVASRTLLAEGPNEAEMSNWNKFHYRKGLTSFVANAEDIAARQEAFSKNPEARSYVLLNNADSVATFVVIAHGGIPASSGQATHQVRGQSQLRSAWQQFRARFN